MGESAFSSTVGRDSGWREKRHFQLLSSWVHPFNKPLSSILALPKCAKMALFKNSVCISRICSEPGREMWLIDIPHPCHQPVRTLPLHGDSFQKQQNSWELRSHPVVAAAAFPTSPLPERPWRLRRNHSSQDRKF